MKFQVAAIFLMIITLSAVSSHGEVCKEVTEKVIKKHLAFDDFVVVSKRELNGLCEVVLKSGNRFITFYGCGNFLISGDMYQDGRSLTESKLYEINRTVFKSSIKEVEDGVVFSYDPPVVRTESTLYMFTDPLCPFCNKIGGEIKDLSDRLGFRVRVLLLNVHGERGRVKCVEAVCRKLADPLFNFEKYNTPDWKKSNPGEEFACEKGSEMVAKAESISEKLGIDSVPFFFVNDGRHVSGASIEEVELLFKSEK